MTETEQLKRPRGSPRQIIHLDMDAFYASVEVLDNPQLKGKPVIVGGCPPRGVVAAASYEARKFGIRSAMPTLTARKLCPAAMFLPVRMQRYREISRQIIAIFQSYTPLVEPISLDEAFLDVTGSTRLFGSAFEIASAIKKEVLAYTGLTVSAGIANSKLVAKIASEHQKPDGLTVVEAGCEQTFLDPLPIARLWGVGKATQQTLALLGVQTIGELRGLPVELLEQKFGKHGLDLHCSAQGLDERQVTPSHEMKSVGHEETYDADILDPALIRKELLALAVQVGRRLRRYGVAGRTVTLKVKYQDFVQITRSLTVKEPTDDDRQIYRQACALLAKTEIGSRPVRLLGISLSHLNAAGRRQGSLFKDYAGLEKRRQLNLAVDAINQKIGADAILPGRLLG